MLNEARLELEDCIKELDNRRNKKNNVDTETELEVNERTVDPPPPRDTSLNNEDTFYADALIELDKLDFSTK